MTRAVLLVRAVREIEAEDVGARGDERVERALGGTGRPDGGDDLGESAHCWIAVAAVSPHARRLRALG